MLVKAIYEKSRLSKFNVTEDGTSNISCSNEKLDNLPVRALRKYFHFLVRVVRKLKLPISAYRRSYSIFRRHPGIQASDDEKISYCTSTSTVPGTVLYSTFTQLLYHPSCAPGVLHNSTGTYQVRWSAVTFSTVLYEY